MVVFAAGLFVLGVGLPMPLFLACLGGRWYVFWLLALAFLWPMLMIGIGIASISKNQVQAIYLLVFVLLTIILMSSMFSFRSYDSAGPGRRGSSTRSISCSMLRGW